MKLGYQNAALLGPVTLDLPPPPFPPHLPLLPSLPYTFIAHSSLSKPTFRIFARLEVFSELSDSSGS